MNESGAEFAYLRKLPVFADLEPADLAAIGRITAERRVERNRLVFADAG